MTKTRGIAVVAVALLALGGILWWKNAAREKAEKPTTTAQGSGSAGTQVTPGSTPTAAQPARATVIVNGPQGPLAGATVRLSRASGDVSIVQTAANGTATSDALEPGEYTISASAAGHEPAAVAPREIATGENVRIELTLVAGGRTLTGQVTDASGGPVAGARIDAAKLGAMVRAVDAVASTSTGADGRYTLTVAEGQLLVAASEPSYAPQSRYLEVGPAGATANFALVPGGVIEGVVRDETTREVVPGGRVIASRDTPAMQLGERSRQQAVAGADGRFRIAGLRPGAYELSGAAGNRVSRAPTIVGLGVAEQVSDIEILVGRAATIRGVVLDETNTPAPNVDVMMFGRGRGGENEAKTDAKGAFVIEGISAGRYMLMANGDPYVSTGVTPIEVATADVDGVKVHVKRGAKLVGYVEPRQVCEVRLERGEDAGPMHMISMVAPRTTAADGAFELSPIDLAKYSVTARCSSGDQGTADVNVVAGTNNIVVKVKPGASITGTVVDGQGKAVAGVGVMANPVGDVERTTIVNGMITSGEQTLTNAAGQFELRGLAAGDYRLGVLDRGRPLPMKTDTTVKLGPAEKKTGVTLAVERPDGVIRGVVTGPDGKPLADAWVSLDVDLDALLDAQPRDGERRSRMVRVERSDEGGASGGDIAPVLTDAAGTFELSGLARVPYTVVAEAQSGALRGQATGVKPDATITIQALGVTELRGVVKASAPLTFFTVELEGPTREQRTFAAADGTFSFGRVDPGTYKVSVTSNAGNGDAKVTVAPGKPATVEVVLAANAIVTGKLVDAKGAPVGGLPVVVIPKPPDGRMQVSIDGPPLTSGPDGTFRVEAKAGPSILLVMTPPSPTTKPDLNLVAGQVTDIGPLVVPGP